ncbi:peptidoglycan/LPS O-acetylase OafA/YrhL [Pedobacter sp. UYEF25]
MPSAAGNATLFKSRQHFEILDGLRGVAALAIVIFHFMEEVIIDYSKNFIGHGYLAVDFFFCLSGFVVAYAYEHRIEEIGFWNFLKLRLIRLHPLIILGAVLGLLTFLFDPFADYQNLYSVKQIGLYFLASIFLIPLKIIPERFYKLFPLNAPSWSLFWEYLANIAFAVFLYRCSKKVLLMATIIGAIFLCYVAFKAKTLGGGWGALNFWDGGARILFSFSMGMLIFKSNLIIKNKIGFIVLAILLFLTFISPYNEAWNYITEPLIVMVVYPLLVALGAGCAVKNGLKKLCNFSGNISYPLYTTHFSIIWIFANFYNSHKPNFLYISWVMVIGTILCVVFAYLILKVYDIPVRKYLKALIRKN